MTEYPAGRGQRPSDLTPGLRLTALIAVIAGVVLLAAAAFLLSYSGIRHIALQAGVSPRLARIYPGIFDAMLVIACAAVLALRGAGWLTRVYVWLCLIVLLAAVAAGDAVNAMGVAIPRQPARAGVAITPWALVLLSFGLLLAMLRSLRRARSGGREPARKPARTPADPGAAATDAAAGGTAPRDTAPAVSRGGLDLLLEPRTGEPPALPTTGHPPSASTAPQPASAPPSPASTAPQPAGPPPSPGSTAPSPGSTAPPPGSSPPAAEATTATTALPSGVGYPADAYFGPDTPDGTEEFYEHEGYEDYAEEFPAAEAGPADERGSASGQPAGQDNGEAAPAGPTVPASAPAGPFDRMRSSPTRPGD